MEEIEIKELLRYYVKKIPMIIVIGLLCLIIGYLYTGYIKKPLYKGETTLVLVKSEGNGEVVTQNDIVLNQKLVSTYSVVIKSKRVLKQVKERLNLEESVSEIAKKIEVSNQNDTEIIKISVSDESGNKAAIIANTIGEVFTEEIKEIYKLENVATIDEAEEETVAYNIDVVKSSAISMIGGMIIAIGILFISYYFDTTIKSSEEIEKRLGVAVIGNIPLTGKKER